MQKLLANISLHVPSSCWGLVFAEAALPLLKSSPKKFAAVRVPLVATYLRADGASKGRWVQDLALLPSRDPSLAPWAGGRSVARLFAHPGGSEDGRSPANSAHSV